MNEIWENIDEEIKNLYWKTAGGERIHVSEMETSHVYNTMKMLYNHLAYGTGLETFSFNKRYWDRNKISSKRKRKHLRKAAAFSVIIERRGDLPYEYEKTFHEIFKILKNPFSLMRLTT